MQCPRLDGIKIYKKIDHDLMIDCKLAYGGDAKFTVSFKHIRAGIRNIELNGNMRLKLKNFMQINSSKQAESVEISFLSTPTVNFELLNALAPLELFSSGDLIRTILNETINSQLVDPNKKSFSL